MVVLKFILMLGLLVFGFTALLYMILKVILGEELK